MATNYWSQQLGFVDDVPSSSAARRSLPLQEQSLNVGANSNSHQQGSSVAPHELDSLESWIVEFENRTAEKEKRNQANALAQLVRDGDQIERWNLFRKEQAAKEKADEDAIREREEQIVQQRLAWERKHAEELRIAASTEGLTEEEREQWIRDEQELLALEKQMAKQQEKLTHFDNIMKNAAAIYDQQREAEAAERARLDAEIAAEQQQLLDSHHQQQLDYLRHATEDKEAILEEEASLRAEAAELMEVAKKELVANTRAVTLANASPQERARLEAMDEECRMDILDEMATLAMLKRRFSTQVSSTR